MGCDTAGGINTTELGPAVISVLVVVICRRAVGDIWTTGLPTLRPCPALPEQLATDGVVTAASVAARYRLRHHFPSHCNRWSFFCPDQPSCLWLRRLTLFLFVARAAQQWREERGGGQSCAVTEIRVGHEWDPMVTPFVLRFVELRTSAATGLGTLIPAGGK